jgi:hypothetical protein
VAFFSKITLVAVNVSTSSVKVSLNLADLGLRACPVRQLIGKAQLDYEQENTVIHLTIDLPLRSGCILEK